MRDRPAIRLAVEPVDVEVAGQPRASMRVKNAARLLDCDETTVRDLLREGLLQGHRIGKRGVRIYTASIVAYQQDGAIQPAGVAVNPRAKATPAQTVAHREALAALKAMGCL